MKTEQPILITTLKVSAASLGAPYTFTKHTFVGMDGAVPNALDPSLGVCMEDHTLENASDTFELPVLVAGIAVVKTGAAVSAGVALEIDGSGYVVTKTTGFLVGVSIDSASGADELIRILLA